jgi:hypothetical protein
MHVLDERSPLHGYDMARKYVTTFVIASFLACLRTLAGRGADVGWRAKKQGCVKYLTLHPKDQD